VVKELSVSYSEGWTWSEPALLITYVNNIQTRIICVASTGDAAVTTGSRILFLPQAAPASSLFQLSSGLGLATRMMKSVRMRRPTRNRKRRRIREIMDEL